MSEIIKGKHIKRKRKAKVIRATLSSKNLDKKVPTRIIQTGTIKDLPPGANYFQAFLRGCDLTNRQKKELYSAKARSGKSEMEMEQIVHDLPHRYGRKWHSWARSFFECFNLQNFLCAANQTGKSTVQMCKDIEWATNKSLWPRLWDRTPNMFWYLYPDRKTATQEFENKWVPDCLPRGEMKKSGDWAWDPIYDGKYIDHISFHSGVSLYFKTYSQQIKNLQSGTCFKISTDEELPVDLYDELMFRLQAVGGYFSMAFTATLCQEFWFHVMESEGKMEELPEAFKQQVSLYDCMFFEDGSPDLRYTEEKIKKIVARCRNKREVKRRVEGRFVRDEGLLYPHYESHIHFLEKPKNWEVPFGWIVYVGIDPGTGVSDTGKAHPAAIVFLCVSPDFQMGIIFDGWRGDDEETTSSDILKKYRELCARNKIQPSQVFYDWHNRDLYIVFSRSGVPMDKANKNRDEGHDLVNTLYRKRMVIIWETDELGKLSQELVCLGKNEPKTKAKDDFCDAARYVKMGVPWDFEGVEAKEEVLQLQMLAELAQKDKKTSAKFNENSVLIDIDVERREASIEGRKRHQKTEGEADWEQDLFEEIRDWNELYE